MNAERMIDALKALLEHHGVIVTKTVRVNIDTPRMYVEPLKDGTFRLIYSAAMVAHQIATLENSSQTDKACAIVVATGYNPDSPGFDACVNAVMREQKPLDCQGVEIGGKGKTEIRECEIKGFQPRYLNWKNS